MPTRTCAAIIEAPRAAAGGRHPLRRHAEPRALLAEIDEAVDDKDAFQYVARAAGDARDKPGVASCCRRCCSWPTRRCRWRPRWRNASGRPSRIVCARASAAQATTTTKTCWRWSRGAARAAGADLAAALRARFRLAIIDEFQDTDPVQWEIFRTIFLDGPRRDPLYVVGDPKQSIYGFRGADVTTYTDACRAIATGRRGAGARPQLPFDGAVIEASTRSSTRRAPPLLLDGRWLRAPGPAGGTAGASDPAQRPPLSLLAREGRRARTSCRCASCARRWRARSPTRSPRCSRAGRAAAARGVRADAHPQGVAGDRRARWPRAACPAVVYGQEGLYETDEARHVRDLLRAIADPHDPAKRLRAWLTPFFALPIAELPAAAAGRRSTAARSAVGVARRRAEPRPRRPVRPHPRRQRRRAARAGRRGQPAPADQLPAAVRDPGRRGGAHRRRRRRSGAPAGGAGGAAGRPRTPKRGTSCASRAIATRSRS